MYEGLRLPSSEEEDPDNVLKILVVGDSGVGKSAFLRLLCSEDVKADGAMGKEGGANWTCGCSLAVKGIILPPTADCSDQRRLFVQFWEVGGNMASAAARSVFYSDFHGVMCAYDPRNLKSFQNLASWVFEVCSRSVPPSTAFWEDECHTFSKADSGDPEISGANEKERRPQLKRTINQPSRPLIERLLGVFDDTNHIWERRVPGCDQIALRKRVHSLLESSPHMTVRVDGDGYLDSARLNEFLGAALKYKRRL